MKKIIVFNWKMGPDSPQNANRLFNDYLKILQSTIPALPAGRYNLKSKIIICPPFVYIEPLLKILNLKSEILNLKLGAQNVFGENQGHYTGEISPKMLKKLGVEYVIIGHSERRQIFGETDEMINKKVLAALEAGLKVILCVGEPKRELGIKNYELGIKKAKKYIRKQLEKNLKNSKFLILNSKLSNHLVIAYEPVWAIGTGHSDTPKDAVEMIKYIKRIIDLRFKVQDLRVLYGGSVNSKNIKNFLQYKEIDGFLVGSASLKPLEIKHIIKSIWVISGKN